MACLQGLLAIPVRSVLRPQPWLSTMTCPVSSLTHFPLCVFQAHLLSLGGFVRAVLPRAHRAWLREQAQQLLEQLDEASEGEEDDSLRASLASWPRRRVAATSRVDVLCCRQVPSPIPRHVGRRRPRALLMRLSCMCCGSPPIFFASGKAHANVREIAVWGLLILKRTDLRACGPFIRGVLTEASNFAEVRCTAAVSSPC